MSVLKLVILGDSITAGDAGIGVTPETAYPSLLDAAFARAGLNIASFVSALHGVYTNYAVRRFNRMVLRHAPDYVLIMLGSNDAGQTSKRAVIKPDDFQTGLMKLVELCQQNNATPILTSPPPRFDITPEYPMENYAEAARNVSQKFNLIYVDLFQKFIAQENLTELFPDGLHPSKPGSQIIANSLEEALVPSLLNADRS